MKKPKICRNCGRKLSGADDRDNPSISEFFCHFCEQAVEKFGKKSEKSK